MQQTRYHMGIPIMIEVVDAHVKETDLDAIFVFFQEVDQLFSTYKKDSAISRYNDGRLSRRDLPTDVKNILSLAQETKQLTKGYFDIGRNGRIDPSGIVKGWAIHRAAQQLAQRGFSNFLIDAGGDIEMSGKNKHSQPWTIGIRHPFTADGIVKVLALSDCGVATSGTYQRGPHIYNPHQLGCQLTEIVSLTVIGPNVYEADRFATAACAMGRKGIAFIGSLSGFAGYQIDADGMATFTEGFDQFVL